MQTPILLAAAGFPLDAGTLVLAALLAALVLAAFRLCGALAEINHTLRKSAVPAPQPSAPGSPAQPTPAPVASPAASADGIPPEVVAVIAAAVAAVTGKACRIVSIKPMSTSWERAGRQSVLTSHRIR